MLDVSVHPPPLPVKHALCSRPMSRRTGAKSPPSDPLEGALRFGVALGHRLRQVREEIGWTGEQVSFHARNFGLGWDRSTVTRIELGQRQLTAAELLVLPLMFSRPLADLLPTEPAALTEAASVGPEELRRVLNRAPALREWYVPRLHEVLNTALERMGPVLTRAAARFPDVNLITVAAAASEGWTDETTSKAARRLGVDREDVAVAAQQRWSHGLAAERDKRLATGGAGDTARGRQAKRGHITRALLEELRPVVEEIQHSRGQEHGDGIG